MGGRRYRSMSNHIAGFDTREEAEEFMTKEWTNGTNIGLVWEWDGLGIPAMTCWFGGKSKTTEAK